ncbi:MAG: hypothetical protein GXY50_04985 [Syntrophomonadaceae bacterium]|nr:hypothetical protein [Syntrophomonadaceae bacterium]
MGALVNSAPVQLIIIALAIYAFVKFCSFAKKYSLPGKVKLSAYILTALSLFIMNYLFSAAKTGLGLAAVMTNPTLMYIALAISLVIVFIFSFALMAETKE